MKAMPEKIQKGAGRIAEDKGKIAWTLLAILLICMPLVAIGQLIVASDDELQDVGAQYLLKFERVNRRLNGPNMYGHVPGGAATTRGIISYDAAVLTIDAQLIFHGVRVSRVAQGYWNDGTSTDWDVLIQDANDGLVFGGRGYPFIFNGLRIELAYDNLSSANPNLLFNRIGTDDLTGCFDYTPDGTTGENGGSIERISIDGRLFGHTNQTDLALVVNSHRATQFFGMNQWPLGDIYVQTQSTWEQFYGTTGPAPQQGDTDFYFSLANTIRDHEGGAVNIPRAFNARGNVNSHVPGRGWWIHFNDSYANVGFWN